MAFQSSFGASGIQSMQPTSTATATARSKQPPRVKNDLIPTSGKTARVAAQPVKRPSASKASADTSTGSNKVKQQQQQSNTLYQHHSIDQRSAVILSSNDVNAIRDTLSQHQQEHGHAHDSDKMHEEQQQQQRFNQWSSTVETERQEKAAARKQITLDSDLKQQAIDDSEKLIQQQQSDALCQHTVSLLYADTDQVKLLMRGVAISGLHVARQEQMQQKRQQQQEMKAQDQAYLVEMQQLALKAELSAKQLSDTRAFELKQLQSAQQQQLLEFKQRKQDIKQQGVDLGVVLKKAAVQREQQQLLDDQQRRNEQQATKQMYMEAHQQQQAATALRAEADRQETLKTIVYSKAQAERQAARAAAELELFEKKQLSISDSINRQIVHLTAIRNNDDNRLQAAQEEFEFKQAHIEKSRVERAAAVVADLEFSRGQQIVKQQQQKAEADAVLGRVLKVMHDNNNKAIAAEQQKQQQQLQRRQETQAANVKQIQTKVLQRAAAAVLEKQEHQQLISKQQQEAAAFAAFVEQKELEVIENNSNSSSSNRKSNGVLSEEGEFMMSDASLPIRLMMKQIDPKRRQK